MLLLLHLHLVILHSSSNMSETSILVLHGKPKTAALHPLYHSSFLSALFVYTTNIAQYLTC